MAGCLTTYWDFTFANRPGVLKFLLSCTDLYLYHPVGEEKKEEKLLKVGLIRTEFSYASRIMFIYGITTCPEK